MSRRPFVIAVLVAVNLVILGLFIQAFLAGGSGQWRTVAESGGAATRAADGEEAYALPPNGLTEAERERFFAGQRLFNIVFVRAPSGVAALDGRGPTFNRPSCGRCHIGNGRGAPPDGPEAPMLSMIVRLSGGNTSTAGPRPFPNYGLQLQDRAIEGVPAEGRARIRWIAVEGRYGDGTAYSLRRPELSFADEAFGPLTGVLTSARIAPPVFGAGLLAAVPEEAVRAAADPEDADGDGISGRINEVRDMATGSLALGRFGWKAGQPTLRQQIADALHRDMGLTTDLFPDENCPPVQTACREAPDGGRPEIDGEQLAGLRFYIGALAVPARRDIDDPQVLMGGRIFGQIGCAACHSPTLRTGEAGAALGLQAGQVIHPYTDLLLHDMGRGLADNRPEYRASGREWRTPPLWGIGLAETVGGGRAFYLHDGRARSLAEAILWHGGEAAAARERFRTLPPDRRDALIAFLRSL